ncbi:MAG: L-threonylcarbamoyladenylate synthase [Bacillota bacterium]
MSVNTEVVKVDPRQPDRTLVARAARVIRHGGLVAFPTETVYGLGADGLNPEAAKKLFLVKGRPQDNPFILHVASVEQAWALVDWGTGDRVRAGGSERAARAVGEAVREGAVAVGEAAAELAGRFWPGPLTLVLPAAGRVPREVTAGLDTVAIRMPDHPVALALIQEAGCPLAGPSANISGRPSPTTADHVLEDLGGRIEMILDAGPTGVGVESTVLDLTRHPPVILRPGGVTAEMLVEVLGEVRDLTPGEIGTGPAPSPGTKYRHYAPRVPLLLAAELPPAGLARLLAEGKRLEEAGRRVGVLVAEEEAPLIPASWQVRVVGSRSRPREIAARLFGAMRDLERLGVDVILALPYAEEGLGRAIMNRLRKASSGPL